MSDNVVAELKELTSQDRDLPNEKELLAALETLNERLDKQNNLLASYLKSQTSFKARLIAGLWTGLGTVLGATVVVSGIVLMLKPLAKIDWISPIVDKVISALESKGGNQRQDRNNSNVGSMYNFDRN